MKLHKTIMLLIFMTIAINCTIFAQEGSVFLREDFDTLEDWKPLHFPKIKAHSTYSVETRDEESYLRAESNASASGIIFKKEFNVFEYPKARWKWKVSNIFKKGNAKEKSGDDYPMRIYIIFRYDPDQASFTKRVKYGLAKKLYGEYPPDSSLNYIWANRKHRERIIPNTYAKEAQMIVLQTGPEKTGTWLEEEVHILEDYRKAFGKDPPAAASLAIMNDSDNTGEHAVSYVDFIEVFREAPVQR